MKEKTRKLLSALLASVMVITTATGAVLALDARETTADEKQTLLVDAGKSNWQPKGEGNTATDSITDTLGGATIAGSAVYGFGYELQKELSLDEISFDLRFDQQTLAISDHFTIAFGNSAYIFDPTNGVGNGVSFLIYKTGDGTVKFNGIEDWREFPFNENNRFTFKKGTDSWELYLKNSKIVEPLLVAKVPFTTVPEATFDNNQAKLGIYVTGAAPSDYTMTVTNVTETAVPGKGDVILTGNGAPVFSNADENASKYELTSISNGVNAKGKSAFGAGVMSAPLDVSAAISFRLKYNANTIPVGAWFAIALVGDGYDFSTDLGNDTGKGVTLLTYKQAENAVQFPGAAEWREFMFTEDNLLTIKKGEAAWEIYLQNSVITTSTLVGSIPYTTVGKDIFNNDMASLMVCSFGDPAVDIDMDITYLTETRSRESDAGLPIVYPEKTFVVPSNAVYWRNDANTEVHSDGATVTGPGAATYTGSRLKDRLAQMDIEAEIAEGKWIGLLMRQSKAGSGMWDQERVYWFAIYSNGKIDLMKNMDILTTVDTSRFLKNGRLDRTTVRFGAVDEIVGGKEYVRLILDIDGVGVVNYLDKDVPFLDHGYSGVYAGDTGVSLRVYTGPEGTDEDKDDIKTGFGEGGGYLGGEINPVYLLQFPNFKDFKVEEPNSTENTVLPEEIYKEIDIDEMLARVKQAGNADVVFATTKASVVPKAVFEALAETEKNLIIKIVDKKGKLLYSMTINGKDVTAPADCNMALLLDNESVEDVKKLVAINDIVKLDFAQNGAFPGKMSVKLCLADRYDEGEDLSLYLFNGKDTITMITKGITVGADGYIKISTTDADGLFLTNEDKDFNVKPVEPNPGEDNGKTGVNDGLAVVMFAIALASGTACIVLNCRKRRIHR